MTEEMSPREAACVMASAIAMCMSVVSIVLTSVWWLS